MQAPALHPAQNPALSPNAVPTPQAALSGNALLGGAAGGADSFSRLLEAADARRQTERSDEPRPAEPPKASASPAPRPATAPAKAAAAEARSTAREAGAEPRRSEAAARSEPADGSAEALEAEEAATDTSPPADPAALLASLGLGLRPAPATDTARGRSAVAATERNDDSTRLAGLAGLAGEGSFAAASTSGAAARRGAGGGGSGGDDTGRVGTAFDTLLAQAQGPAAEASAWAAETQALAPPGTPQPAEARPAEASLPGLAAAGALGAQAAAGAPGSSASAPAEARLSHSPGSAAFASELGTQISTFVREGVQHAKLQLHPLELGPVTVQIQLDGGSAHMSFAAEHAQTRQALEQALPTLASSLREAGLTLSGGGVFEQPHQQAQADNGSGNGNAGRGGERGSAETAAAAVGGAGGADTPARRRGVVDLVA